jgi:hypothetical protein
VVFTLFCSSLKLLKLQKFLFFFKKKVELLRISERSAFFLIFLSFLISCVLVQSISAHFRYMKSLTSRKFCIHTQPQSAQKFGIFDNFISFGIFVTLFRMHKRFFYYFSGKVWLFYVTDRIVFCSLFTLLLNFVCAVGLYREWMQVILELFLTVNILF